MARSSPLPPSMSAIKQAMVAARSMYSWQETDACSCSSRSDIVSADPKQGIKQARSSGESFWKELEEMGMPVDFVKICLWCAGQPI